jgi:hypothetical protein
MSATVGAIVPHHRDSDLAPEYFEVGWDHLNDSQNAENKQEIESDPFQRKRIRL